MLQETGIVIMNLKIFISTDTYDKKIQSLYSLVKINNGIDNIVDKKYAWVENWLIFLHVFFYITLTFSLLVFIFRHSTVKTFFLSLLTAVILLIFTGIMMLLSNGSEMKRAFILLSYYIMCFSLSLLFLPMGLR